MSTRIHCDLCGNPLYAGMPRAEGKPETHANCKHPWKTADYQPPKAEMFPTPKLRWMELYKEFISGPIAVHGTSEKYGYVLQQWWEDEDSQGEWREIEIFSPSTIVRQGTP